MKTVKLGAHGPKISQFGIGAMSFAGIYGNATQDESHAVLDALRAAQVSHIDTSNVYGAGRSEEIIGTWFAANPGARDETTIATKAGITGNPEKRFDNSPDHIEAELDGSLKRLGVDYVDLFYIHRREPERPIEEVAGTLAGLMAKGKAKAVGFSEIAPTSLRRATTEVHVAAVQSEYSLSTRLPELGLSQACAELGTALVAFCPVGRAFLTDRPFPFERVQEMAFTKGNPRFIEPNYSANIKATDKFRALAQDMGEPAAALAIAWLIAQGDHVIPIPGTKSVAHLKELLRGTEISLSQSDISAIESVLPVGWAHGDRYSAQQWVGPEMYC
ncbi:MAG: aldo/keto reductase [Silicimonas sp.]|nr:aldo/keto reductase [Silicimonas sp.]